MEQLFATPAGRLEVILGKLAPYVVIGMIQVLLVLTLGTVLFRVPIRGSMVLLFGASLVFLIAMLAQGLFISVVTKNQQVATQIGVVSTMLPTILLSGFLFPIDNMPRPLQIISYMVPSRYFIAMLRGIMLKGAGMEYLWPQFAAMCAFSLLLIVASGLRFQRRLA
jgi:ABC-2 type transport system permease protein